MSIRAYLEVTAPVLAKTASFKLGADEELIDALVMLDECSACCEQYCQIELYIPSVKDFLETASPQQYSAPVLEAIQKDLAVAEAADEFGYMTYHCR